jgi:PAS domain S-box-containing protein
MSGTEPLSEKILARIALLQSMAAMLPNKKSVLEFICQGLSEVAGISHVDYYIPDCKNSLTQENDRGNLVITFPLKHNSILYADLIFHLVDPDVFEPYKPYISNFTNMLAVIFEQKAQRELNSNLIAELEQRVIERTRELQTSKEMYEEIVQKTSDLIVTADKNGKFTFLNRVAEKIFGVPAEKCIGTSLLDFTHPDDYTKTKEVLYLAKANHIEKTSFESRQINKQTGEITHLLWAVNFQFNNENCIEIVHGIAHDITVRKKAEEEHQKYEHQLQQTQKLESLGILAGGIAHDFNNLMGGLYGYIDMAKEGCTNKDVALHLDKAMNTIERARSLTQQLLTFAKGGLPVKKTGNLFPFIEDTIRFVLSGSNVSCSFTVPEDLWACNFDKNQIGQVIDNLVINAKQAMSSGGNLTITAENIVLGENKHPVLAAGSYVKVSVIDTGDGIPQEIITKIFDPFFSTKATGHGLGLATCYSILTRHNGSLDVESTPGKGSIFHILLPAALTIYPAEEQRTEQSHRGSGLFLVMDDEEVMRDILSIMLQSLGYTVICTVNGQEAIDFAKKAHSQHKHIKGMIFDLTIPGGMGGLEAIGEIRKFDDSVPVFVSSGYTEGFAMKNPEEYGFTASLDKPFRKTELVALLEKYLK